MLLVYFVYFSLSSYYFVSSQFTDNEIRMLRMKAKDTGTDMVELEHIIDSGSRVRSEIESLKSVLPTTNESLDKIEELNSLLRNTYKLATKTLSAARNRVSESSVNRKKTTDSIELSKMLKNERRLAARSAIPPRLAVLSHTVGKYYKMINSRNITSAVRKSVSSMIETYHSLEMDCILTNTCDAQVSRPLRVSIEDTFGRETSS